MKPVDSTFRKVLDDRGIKLSKMSEDTGIPLTTLYEWRRGEHIPRLETVMIVSNYLGIPVNDLFVQREGT